MSSMSPLSEEKIHLSVYHALFTRVCVCVCVCVFWAVQGREDPLLGQRLRLRHEARPLTHTRARARTHTHTHMYTARAPRHPEDGLQGVARGSCVSCPYLFLSCRGRRLRMKHSGCRPWRVAAASRRSPFRSRSWTRSTPTRYAPSPAWSPHTHTHTRTCEEGVVY